MELASGDVRGLVCSRNGALAAIRNPRILLLNYSGSAKRTDPVGGRTFESPPAARCGRRRTARLCDFPHRSARTAARRSADKGVAYLARNRWFESISLQRRVRRTRRDDVVAGRSAGNRSRTRQGSRRRCSLRSGPVLPIFGSISSRTCALSRSCVPSSSIRPKHAKAVCD
jgi:hypothetical protein